MHESGNIAWMLMASALVLLMTPGLAFFYGGLVRGKNVVSTLMYSFVAMGVVSIIWVLWGYSLAFSGGNEIIGTFKMLGLQGLSFEAGEDGALTEGITVVFQMMFAIITPALITGAFAERFKFTNCYCRLSMAIRAYCKTHNTGTFAKTFLWTKPATHLGKI